MRSRVSGQRGSSTEPRPAPAVTAVVAVPPALNEVDLLLLQRVAGNQAVTRLLRRPVEGRTTTHVLSRQVGVSPPISTATPSTLGTPELERELRQARAWYADHATEQEAPMVKDRITLLERELIIRQGTGSGPLPGAATPAPGVSLDRSRPSAARPPIANG